MDKTATDFPEKQTWWGTLEELLLACAVHRYGTDDWSSVAAQVQKRSSTLKSVTPHSCRDKYLDLSRRFAHYDAVSLTDSPDIPWLDELKKLRVAELKREVERYDLSIVSLQLKVKRLTEEREQKLTEKETQSLDLEKTVENNGEQSNKIDQNNELKNSGEESDRENRSVNESNSTDPKAGDTEKGSVPEEPTAPETEDGGDDIKTAKEDSCNGSCGSAAKESARNSERVDSLELLESVAESRDSGEEGNGKERESSDVQSSASLSRKEEKVDEPDAPENEENQSLAIKCVSVESQPLVEFLEIIRSHKLSSIFERRLDFQETPDFRNMIRQHVDLGTVRMRLEENLYSGCKSSFFRDLLLVFNNAIVFFGKNSPESLAAIELREVVLKEMSLRMSNMDQLLKGKSRVSSAAQNVKLDTESSDSLLLKPNISLPLIACRKRSSIAARGSASASSSGADKKREQTAALIDKKPVLHWKKHDKSDDEHVPKKRTRERSASGARSSSARSSSKNAKSRIRVDHSNEVGSADNEKPEAKAEKDKNNPNAKAKKRRAANFLSRITRSSPSKNESLLEASKSPVTSSDNGRKGAGAEQKKTSNGKIESGKDQNLRTSSAGKRAKEKEPPTKRTKGRPPRKAAVPHPLESAAHGKRSREGGGEGGELEAAASGRARKRSKIRMN